MEEEREYHRRYLRAVNNPVRRTILQTLKSQDMSFKDLQSRLNLAEENLCWHLYMLENGYCIIKVNKDDQIFYRLTKEGKIIDYL
jgi:DNA-binding transcriptional ArsR family regulator